MIEALSIQHFISILFNLVLAIIIYQVTTRLKNKRIIFGICFSIIFIFDNALRIYQYNYGVDNPYNLFPFSLCGIAYIISIIAIFTNNSRLFKYSVFFSIGTFIAIFAPSQVGLAPIASLSSIRYNLTHIMIVVAQVFMFKQLGFRIKKQDGIRVFFFLLGLCIVMFGLNILWNTNFFFINQKLEGNIITQYLGQWPIYLIWFFLLGFVLMQLFEKIMLKVQKNV